MKSFYKFLMPLVAIVAMALPARSQDVSAYTLATGTDATMWVTLSPSATSVTSIYDDDEASSLMDIGFTFTFAGANYTQWSCNSNGRIALGSTAVDGWWVNPFTPTNITNARVVFPLIAALGMDNTLEGSGVWCKYEVVGTAPNRTLVIEYRTPSEYDVDGDLVDYQIQFDEGTNVVRFVYGSTDATSFDDFQAGMASGVDDVITISSTHTLLTGATTAVLDEWPGENRYYEFTPPTSFCSRVASASIATMGPDFITLSWVDNNSTSWLVRIDSSSTTGTPVMVSDTFYTFDNLAPQTQYTVSVAALCDGGDTSAWRSITTTTPCTFLDAIPYIYGFEDAATGGSSSSLFEAPCWNRITGSSSSYYPYISSNSSYCHTGARGLYWYGSSSYDHTLVLPGIDGDEIPVNTLQLKFWAKNSSTSYHAVLEIGVMTDPNDISTFQQVGTVNVEGTTWTEYETFLSTYTGTGNFVAVRSHNPSSYWYAYFDDFTLDLMPACPHVAEVVVDSATSESLSVSWTPAGNESSWLVYLNDSLVDLASSSSYVFSDLEINTLYAVGVRALCDNGDTADIVTVSYRTLAGDPISEFPYVCGFEYDPDNDINEGADWVLENGTQTNQWFVGSAVNNGGSRAMYVSNDNGTSNSYTNTTTSYTFAYATFSFEAGEYTYSYDWHAYGESSYDFIRAAVVPNTVEFTAGAYCGFNNTSGVPAGGVAIDGANRLNLQSNWQTQVGTFTIANDGLYKVVFMWRNDGSAGTQPPAAIDNIMIALNTCPAPVALTVDSIMPEQVDVHWSPLGTESEWAIRLGDSLITGITDTFYSITELEQYTQYTMRVYAVCGEGDTSVASNSITARTTVTCPWPSGLTTTTIASDTIIVAWTPGGEESAWEVVIGNDPAVEVYETTYTFSDLNPNTPYTIKVRAICGADDTSAWTTAIFRTACGDITTLPFSENFDTYGSSDFPSCWTRVISNSRPYTTTNYGNSLMFAGTAGAIMPLIQVLPSQMVVSFDLRKEGSSSGQMNFGYTTNPNSLDSMVVLQTIDPSTTATYFHYEFNLSTDSNVLALTEPVYICWRQSSTSTIWYYWLDNVLVEQVNDCAKPDNFVVNGAIADSVVAQWSEMGEATAWQLFVGPVGATPDADSAIDVNDTSYVFTNLAGGVAYDMYVRSDCGGDYSNWRGPVSVTPGSYIMGPGNATISMCGGAIYDDGGPNGDYANSFDGMVTIYPAAADSMLTFYGTLAHESCCDHLYIYEGVGDGGNLLWSDQSMATNQTIPLDTCVSGPITIKWHADGSSVNAGFEIFVNCVAAPQCSPVEALTVKTTPTAALVTWQPGYYGTYSGATVEYKVDTVETWTALPAVTGTYAIITGLDPNTNYNLRVTTDCEGFPGGVATANFVTRQFPCEVEDTTQSTTGTIGTGTSETSGVPVNSSWGNTMCQSIYLASELTDMGLGNTITSITYTWTNNSTYAKDFSIYMTNTSASEFTSASASNWQPTGAAALVYNGPHPTGTSGSVTYQLTTPFVWDGSSNICITTTMNQPAGASHTSSGFYGKSTVTSPQVYRTMYKYQDSNPIDGSNPASVSPSSRSYYRPNITLSTSGCSQYGTCAAPAVAVTEVTTTTATVVWAPGNTETSWNLYYRMAGDANWSAPVAVTGNTYTVSGLTQGRKYEFRLENTCTEGNFAGTAQATLLCAQISDLPFTENFNGWGTGVAPNCWSNAASSSPASYGVVSGSYNHGSTAGRSVYMYSPSTLTNKTYLALPELDTLAYPVNQLQLVFSLLHTTASYGRPAIEVGVMTNPSDASTFVVVDTVQHSGALSTWEVFEVPLTTFTGNGSYVAMRTAFDSAYSYFYLDNVTLETIPTCPRPDSLTASNATSTTVDLAWHERGSATQWIIEYGPHGFQPGTGTIVNANTNPFTLTGVPVAFQGEYYVKSVCGAGDTGEFSRMPCGFETTQIPATLPYNYDFENVAEWQNWQTSTNHATNNWYRGTSVADSGSYAMYIAGGDTASYFDYTFNSVVNAAAYRDIDFGPIDSSYTLSFRARVGGTVDNRYDALMVFLVDPSLPTVPSTSNITTPWGNVNDLYRIAMVYLDTTWQTYEASFDTISGVHRVAFFWFNQNTGASYTNIPQPAAVDNIHIDYSSCPRPLNVAINAGSTSAHVTWQGPAAANYEVIYRQYPGNYANSYATTTTNSITLNGLTSNAQYAVWVRKLCSASDTSLTSDGELFTTTLCEGGTEALNYDPSASSTTSSYSPIGYSTYNYSYVQTIVDSANLAGLVGDITAFAFNPVNGNKGDYFTNMTVFMANVSESDLSSDFILPDATHSFVKVIDSADFTYTEGGWQIHNLDTAFAWDGHSNLLIAVIRDHGTWSSGASFVAHTATASKMRYAYRDTSPFDYTNPDYSSYSSSTVGDIRLISCGDNHCLAPVVSSTTATDNSITVNFVADSAVEVAITDGIWDSETTGTEIMGNTHTFTGLDYNTTYTIGLRSVCAEGAVSDWSIVTVTTEDVPCMEPTALAISDITFRGATATWTAGGEEANWEVHIFNTNINESYTTTAPTYAFSNLTTGTQYSVSVRALCGSDASIEGPWSDTVVFTTDECQATTQVSASSLTATTATISWAAAGNGTGSYILEYGFRGMSQGEGTSVTVNATSYTITGLQPETEYDVYISTVCEGGVMSVWSNVYSFTTPAASGNIYTISAVPADPTMGSVQGGGSYEENMQITLTAVPNEGYHFVRWQDGNTDNPRVVTVTGNATYVATFEANAGIEDINGAGYVSLYPNPASSTVTVSIEGNESEVVVTIVDMNGREVKRERTSGSELTMDISSLSQGAYFVRLTGERVNAIRKLIVK